MPGPSSPCRRSTAASTISCGSTDGQPVDHRPETLADVPARTALSEQLSRELKHYGFRYMGPVITYSYMQAAGLVNDHLLSCAFR